LEMEIALLQNDISWSEESAEHGDHSLNVKRLLEKWQPRLAQFQSDDLDESERKLLSEALRLLASLPAGQGNH